MEASNITANTVSDTNTAAPGGTLDSSKIIPSAKSGVTLGEQQTVQRALPNEYTLTEVNRRAVSHLADAKWSLQSMLERENYVATLVWDTTTSAGTQLASYNVIEDLLQLTIASMPFKSFRYWRASNVTVRFQLTANRFLSGRLLVWFQPNMTSRTEVAPPNLANQVLLQHVWLDPSAATPVDIVIPFNFYKGWVNLETGDVLGTLGLTVFNPLSAAVGTTPSVDVKVFVTVKDSEFKVPLPGAVAYARARTTPHSAISNPIDSVFHSLVDSFMPSEIVGDLLGGLLDKPENPVDPDPIAHKDQGYLSNARGIAHVEKLTLDPSAQQLVDAEHFATEQDELDMNYLLKKKYSYVATVSWKATDAPGTILYEEEVGPLLNFLSITPGTRMIDFISRLFHYWRGAINYMLDIVGTQFHEGRLDVLFAPGVGYSITDYKQVQSLYIGSIVMRNGENSMAFTCPFLSDTPWKQVHYGADLSNDPSDTYRFDDFSSGHFQIVVSSSLRAPTNVTPDVLINIFQSAGSDFELCMPSYYNYSLDIPPVGRVLTHEYPSAHTTPHGSETDMPNLNNTADKLKTITLAPMRAATYDPKVKHFGDKYTSLRELAKRYQLLTIQPLTFTGNIDQRTAIVNGFAPIMVSIPINSNTITGYMRNLFNMYRLIRGPMRFKVRLNTSKNTTTGIQSSNHGYINFLPQPGYQATATGVQDLDVFFGYDSLITANTTSNVPRARFSDTQTAEFEVEFASNYSTQLVAMQREARNKGDEMPYFSFNLIAAVWLTDPDFTNLSKYSIEVYIAFGDTTHMGAFIGLPDLAATVISGKSPYPDLWYQTSRFSNKFNHIKSKSQKTQQQQQEWEVISPAQTPIILNNNIRPSGVTWSR